MSYIVYFIAIMIIVSKFLDCYTTSSQIVSICQERNPLARKIMKILGIQKTIWGIWSLSIIIVGVSVWLLLNFYNSTFYKTIFIVLGLIITITQLAVVHTNKSKKLNIFTKFLFKKYGNN